MRMMATQMAMQYTIALAKKLSTSNKGEIMAEINEIALLKSVRAVDFKIAALQEQIDQTADDGDKADLEDEMLSYMKAAASLRVAYEETYKVGCNLPPYEKLVRC
jgi:flagellar basal body rod protein FlgB